MHSSALIQYQQLVLFCKGKLRKLQHYKEKSDIFQSWKNHTVTLYESYVRSNDCFCCVSSPSFVSLQRPSAGMDVLLLAFREKKNVEESACLGCWLLFECHQHWESLPPGCVVLHIGSLCQSLMSAKLLPGPSLRPWTWAPPAGSLLTLHPVN